MFFSFSPGEGILSWSMTPPRIRQLHCSKNPLNLGRWMSPLLGVGAAAGMLMVWKKGCTPFSTGVSCRRPGMWIHCPRALIPSQVAPVDHSDFPAETRCCFRILLNTPSESGLAPRWKLSVILDDGFLQYAQEWNVCIRPMKLLSVTLKISLKMAVSCG